VEINSYPVEIKDRFYRSFEQIHEFILGQSYQSSQRLNREIVDIISLICERPDSFNIGRITNSGKIFRYAKVMRSYKVYFFVGQDKIYLIDILHEKRSSTATDYMEEI
jgi:hypothetical protein